MTPAYIFLFLVCANDFAADIHANLVIYTEARTSCYTQTGDRSPGPCIHHPDYR